MSVIIKAENLGKKYIIGHQRQQRYQSLRDTMTHSARSIWQKIRHPLSPNRETVDLEELWALENINFEVQQGERLGIIGRNGAGKSTLLKVLSRITEPSTGRVRLRGRVSSLLEVGTGFHLELSGRENIFLNGAILGMTRQEIKQKFDEIVAFAEIEKFLDTPVKRYSSGMYVRLAFAVAAHLEPEILIVDEVLAVGDAAFQKKCLGKMENVAKEGRTVLFVSHNMGAIEKLCNKCIWIDKGKVRKTGDTMDVIQKYLSDSKRQFQFNKLNINNKGINIVSVSCINQSKNKCQAVKVGDEWSLSIEYETKHEMNSLKFGISIEDQMGKRISASYTGIEGIEIGSVLGKGIALCKIPRMLLVPGTYQVSVAIANSSGEIIEKVENAVLFDILGTDLTNSGNLVGKNYGIVWLDPSWEV